MDDDRPPITKENYFARLEEILDDDDDNDDDASIRSGPADSRLGSDQDEEDGFLYTGNDAPQGYDAQLADLLDEDLPTNGNLQDEKHVRMLVEAPSEPDDAFDYSKFKVNI